MQTLLLIDGNALAHRAFHALPPFKTKNGVPTNALYGFVSVLYKVVSELSPDYLIVCLDYPAPTFRDKIFPEYRAHRPKTEDSLIKQFPMIKEFLLAAGVAQVEKEGLEADDLIATFDTQAHRQKLKTVILSGDRDLFQLVDEDTAILTPQLGFSNGKIYDTKAVKEKFGVDPEHIADYKALAGDPSDNYKGVPGIGPKTAAELIGAWGSVENIYKNIEKIDPKLGAKLKAGKESALLAKKLAVLEKEVTVDLSLDQAKFSGYDETLRDFFAKYEFRTLSGRYFKNAIEPQVKKVDNKISDQDQIELF